MKLKTYIKLLFHVVVVLLIILSAPITLVILLNNQVADWITIVSSLASSPITIFFGIKYMIFIVCYSCKRNFFYLMFIQEIIKIRLSFVLHVKCFT